MTEPDPKTVREIGEDAIREHTAVLIRDYVTGLDYLDLAEYMADQDTIGGVYLADLDGPEIDDVQRRILLAASAALVTVSWPDEQPQDVAGLTERASDLAHELGEERADRVAHRAEIRRLRMWLHELGYDAMAVDARLGASVLEDEQPQDERDACSTWLDARQADVAHDHDRSGMTPDSCYCGLPTPCEQRADDMAAIEQLRAVLGRRAELVAEAKRARAELAELRPEYGVRITYTSTRMAEMPVGDDADEAADQVARIAQSRDVVAAVTIQRPVGAWKAADDA